MKNLRKHQFIIATLFVACFLSAFTIKTSHSLEAHSKAFVCEHHEEEGIHFHESSESAGECCPICDFFFSPFNEQIAQQPAKVFYFSSDFIIIPIKQIATQFVSFFYSLRAPPF